MMVLPQAEALAVVEPEMTSTVKPIATAVADAVANRRVFASMIATVAAANVVF